MLKPTIDVIKREYIQNDVSVATLAKKYGYPKDTLARRATKEKWVEAREKFREKTTKQIIEKTSSVIARHEATRRELYEEALDRLYRRMVDAINDDRSCMTKGALDADKILKMWRGLESARSQLGEQVQDGEQAVIIIPDMDAERTPNKGAGSNNE